MVLLLQIYLTSFEMYERVSLIDLGELDLNLKVIQPNLICGPIVPENDLMQESCCPHLPSLGKKSCVKCAKWPFWSLGYNFFSPKQGNGGNRILIGHTLILSIVWSLSLVELIWGWGFFIANSPRLYLTFTSNLVSKQGFGCTRVAGRTRKRAFGAAKRPREISSDQARRQDAYFFRKGEKIWKT